MARPAATADRTAAAVEQAQADVMAFKNIDELDLGLVELPPRRNETAILVAVGIAEHDFLYAAAAVHEAPVVVQCEQPIHDLGRRLQILDGLEQRHDIDAAAARGIDEPDLLQQHGDLQHVGDALAHGDDALGDRRLAELGVDLRRHPEQRELAERLFAVFDEQRRQWPCVLQFRDEQRDARVLIQ